MKTYEGTYTDLSGARFGIVATRFNHFIVDRLLDGALDCLARHGVPADAVIVVRVPGAWELPLACSRLARSGRCDSVIALGAVIRGGTPHFDYIAAEAAKGIAQVMLSTGVPIHFGVLTTDTIEQAIERAGTKAGNKGADAALAALETVGLARALAKDGL